MKLCHAQIISELLYNAGYVDDADELLGERYDETGEAETMTFAQEMDELIAEVNSVLPADQQITTTRSMVEEVKLLCE